MPQTTEQLPHNSPGIRDPRQIHVLLLLTITALAYCTTLDFPFLAEWDDPTYVVKNAEQLQLSVANVKRYITAPFFHNYHPLTMFSYMIDYAVGGMSPIPYRLQNLFWHLLAVIAVYECLRVLKLGPTLACFLAMAWAVHPQRVESVAWVSERKDVLCGAFFLWGFWIYTACPRRRWLAFVFFVLAAASKAMAVSFAPLILVWEWHSAGNRLTKRALLRILPYLVVTAVVVKLAFVAQDTTIQTDVTLARRLGLVCYNLCWYAWKLTFPAYLSPMYPHVALDASALVRVVLTFGLIGGVVFAMSRANRTNQRLKNSWPALAAYPLVLAPVSGIVPLAFIDHADRYSYLPSVVLLWYVGLLCQTAYAILSPQPVQECCCTDATTVHGPKETVRKPRRLALVVGISALALLSIQTWTYSRAWQSFTQLLFVASDRPITNPIVIGTLADRLLAAGEYEAAWQLADKLGNYQHPALRPAARVAHEMKAAFLKGSVLFRQGAFSDAFPFFDTTADRVAAGDTSTFLKQAEFFAMYGEICLKTGHLQKAVTSYSHVIEANPDTAAAFANRGTAYHHLGQHDRALADFTEAQRIDPNLPEIGLRLREAALGRDEKENSENAPAERTNQPPNTEPENAVPGTRE